jgi:hypothetical protein
VHILFGCERTSKRLLILPRLSPTSGRRREPTRFAPRIPTIRGPRIASLSEGEAGYVEVIYRLPYNAGTLVSDETGAFDPDLSLEQSV